MAVVCLGALTGCGGDETPKAKALYNISFDGNVKGENYSVAGSTWEKSEEEGFEAVYTLKGEVKYDKATADAMGYNDGRANFVLIRFTSDSVTKVSYDEETDKGFYAILNKGTANEKIKHTSFTTDSSTGEKTTYYFYQGVDNTVRTLTMNISFDGTKEHEVAYKFVIDPANYTLEAAPANA